MNVIHECIQVRNWDQLLTKPTGSYCVRFNGFILQNPAQVSLAYDVKCYIAKQM